MPGSMPQQLGVEAPFTADSHTFETLPLYQQWQAGPSFHRAAVVEQTIPHTSSWKGITEGSEHVTRASRRPGAGLRLFTDVTVSVTLELILRDTCCH